MQNFRTLELAIQFSLAANKANVKGHLREQLQRAASSIALNLSEGNAKGSAKDKRNFFHMAYGSARECQTIFRLAGLEDEDLAKQADTLAACLYKLVNSELKDSPNWRKGH